MKPKRVVSLLVAGCMAVSMVPASAVTAFAAETGMGSSITAPNASETVAVTVTVSGSGQLENAVREAATAQNISDITTITNLTVVGGPLNADDFKFLSGVTVNGSASDRYKGSSFSESDVKLNSMTELNLSGITNTNIPARAFNGNKIIEKIILPENLERIGLAAFAGMENLEFLSTDEDTNLCFEGLQIIGESIVFGDKKLDDDLHLPSSLQRLSPSSFEESGVKGAVTIGGNVNIIDNVDIDSNATFPTGKRIFLNTNISELTFESGITKICESFAYGCTGLKKVSFANTVKEIEYAAFANTGLEGTLIIPQSVEKIGMDAFNRAEKTGYNPGDVGVDAVIIENPSVQLSKRSFANVKYGTKIYLYGAIENPQETADKYWYDSQVVILNTDGGKIDPSKPVDEKTGLYTPEKEGYTFVGWYDAKGNKLETAAAVNNTYTAKWKCTVSFNTNGHGTKPDDVVVEKGATLSTEELSAKNLSEDGWVFDGWYLDPDFNNRFSSGNIIDQNTTVYAKWHEFTNTTIEATASKDGEYLLSEPVEIDFKVNIGDDIGSIKGISLEYGDEVESVKLNGETLDEKDYTTNKISEILQKNAQNNSGNKLTLTVKYNKTGKHIFGVVLKDSAEKETSKASVDVTVVRAAMNDAGIDADKTYKVGEPVKAPVEVTFNDSTDKADFEKGTLYLTYDKDTEVTLNGKVLDGTEYKVADLLNTEEPAAVAQIATYAMEPETLSIPLEVTFKTPGEHEFGVVVKDANGDLFCQNSVVVNVVKAEEQKPDDGKKDDTEPENPVTTYALTVADGTVKVNGKDAAASESGAYAVEKDAKVEVTFDKTTLSDAQVFDQWTITPASVLNAVDPKSETISFTMPAEEVTIKAMTRDATIEDDGPGVLGTAAMIGVGVAGTAVLGYQGYMIGTELYLKNVLPAGAAIPQNYSELALLVWTDAGKPAPAAVLAADATDEQKAMTWAIENQLISADKAADASVTRWEVIQTWNQEQEMKG